MEASAPPHQPIDLATPLYLQVVHTLIDRLPPPLDDTPEALYVRNHAAIAKVAALLPVNANELDLAAQCIAARAQAEDVLRLLRQHTGDIRLTMRLNAQYATMVRNSLSVHARLMKMQALRHKREAIDAAANQDAWTQHVAEQSMAAVLNTNATPREAASPERPPTKPPITTQPTDPTAALVDHVAQRIKKAISEGGIESHREAFETWMSEQPWHQDPKGPGETSLRMIGEAIKKWRSDCPDAPVTGRESPEIMNDGRHGDGKSAPA